MYKILILILLSLAVPAVSQTVNAIGPYPCFFSLQPLDKVEYSSGETVTIRVQHCREDSFDTATLIIADGMKMHPFEEDFWQKVESGDGIVHKESKQASYGDVEFNYTIPKNSATYRYLVLITPGGMGGADFAYFFSKENASKIVISDVKVLNPKVRQGEVLTFGLKVTDGIGNPLPFVVLNPSANYVTCDGRDSIQNSVAILEKSEDERKKYLSSGVMWGWLPIPIGVAGTYELDIEATTVNYVNQGWTPAAVKGIKFEVLKEAAKQDYLELYTDIADYPLSEYAGYRNFTDIRITSVDALYITGQLHLSQCTPSSQQQIPVKAELLEMQMNLDALQKQFGTGTIRYGPDISCYKIPSICTAKTIETRQLEATVFTSDSSFIAVPQDMLKRATLKPGEYMVTMSTEFQGSNYQNSVGIRVHNTKDYIINAEGREFGVVVDAWYSKPGELEFNKDSKKIIASLETSKEPKMVDIFVPHELLDGKLTVLMNGEKVIDEQTNIKSRGLLKKDTIFSQITLFPETDNTNVEIIGTTVVPEFTIAVVILSASVAGLIIAVRFTRGIGS